MNMKVADVEAVFKALQERRVRFLLVGGAAVVAYGYGRLTYDLDLVEELSRDPEN